jgi:hypothetical protein
LLYAHDGPLFASPTFTRPQPLPSGEDPTV